jgi:hypothetical protein
MNDAGEAPTPDGSRNTNFFWRFRKVWAPVIEGVGWIQMLQDKVHTLI